VFESEKKFLSDLKKNRSYREKINTHEKSLSDAKLKRENFFVRFQNKKNVRAKKKFSCPIPKKKKVSLPRKKGKK
jgi:hypothetical protein